MVITAWSVFASPLNCFAEHLHSISVVALSASLLVVGYPRRIIDWRPAQSFWSGPQSLHSCIKRFLSLRHPMANDAPQVLDHGQIIVLHLLPPSRFDFCQTLRITQTWRLQQSTQVRCRQVVLDLIPASDCAGRIFSSPERRNLEPIRSSTCQRRR